MSSSTTSTSTTTATTSTTTASPASPDAVFVSSSVIGLLGDDSPIAPGTIAFIVCVLLAATGFSVLLFVYAHNHRVRVREFAIELSKRRAMRERERAMVVTEAERDRQAKLRVIEERDMMLRYRQLQGYDGYDDGNGLEGMSPVSGGGSPYAPSLPPDSPNGSHSRFNDYVVDRGFIPASPPSRQQASSSPFAYETHRGSDSNDLLVRGRLEYATEEEDPYSVPMVALPKRPDASNPNYYR